jgi:hypothetical protein
MRNEGRNISTLRAIATARTPPQTLIDSCAMKTFNPTSEHPGRAVQAWQILVEKAMNRQTMTYEGLSKLSGAPKVRGNRNEADPTYNDLRAAEEADATNSGSGVPV